MLRVSREIRRLINERATSREIREQAVREGMMDARRAVLLKVADGLVSTEEMMRVIPVEYLLPESEQ